MQENPGWASVHVGEIHPERDNREVDGSIRLDLGCGDKKQKGWTGVDIRCEDPHHPDGAWKIKPDIEADITKRLPFPDNYADEMRAIHVIEHFWPWDVDDIIAEWVRVLKPGCQLALECPDINKVLALAQVPNIPPNMTFWALYGDPRHKSPEMMHRWCYSDRQLAKIMARAGLVGIRPEPARFHHPIRDMRVVGVKPEPESKLVVTS